MDITVNCSKCGRSHEAQVYPGINVAETPELKDRVKDGSLFLTECPYCGQRDLVSTSLLYHDPAERLMILLTNEPSSVDPRLLETFRTSEVLAEYSARIVTSVGDLIEKVNIFDAGLDDVVLEMCKYVTLMEMQGKDVPRGLKFVSMSGADNELTLTYPHGSQMEMLAVGFNVYEDCAGIVSRNPVIKEHSKGLVSIDQAWISRFFR